MIDYLDDVDYALRVLQRLAEAAGRAGTDAAAAGQTKAAAKHIGLANKALSLIKSLDKLVEESEQQSNGGAT